MKPPDSPEEKAELIASFNRGFNAFVPHNAALKLELVDFDERTASIRLPYAEHLVGNPETGVLHGGAITALMDACCGAATFMRLNAKGRIATLDLRIDYLRPAKTQSDVVAKSECYKLTRNIAFVRGTAHDGDPADPIISAAGAFVVFTPEQREAAIGKNR